MLRFLHDLGKEVSHGAFLKGAALCGRALFLLLVAPRLQVGELAEYVFLASVAGLAGRALGLGMEQQLPLEIAGSASRAGAFARFAEVLLWVEIAIAALFVVSGSDWILVALLAICYVTTSLLAGTLRTIRIEGSERLRDLHWVIFALLAIIPAPWTATEMLALMCASLMSVQFLEARLNRVEGIVAFATVEQIASKLKAQVRRSWKKLFAGVALLAVIRGIILWPKGLGLGVSLDALAYALLLGEAFWQTAMILVYRRYARYCVQGRKAYKAILRDARNISFALMGYTVFAAGFLILASRMDVAISGFDDWLLVAQMVVFFGGIACYMLLRYVVWVFHDFDWKLVFLEATIFLSQGVAVLLLPVALWPAAAIVVLGIAVLIASRLAVSIGVGIGRMQVRRQMNSGAVQ